MRVLAIDPGRSKCGIAILEPDEIIYRAVVSPEMIRDSVVRLVSEYSVDEIVIGASTERQPIEKRVREAVADLPLHFEDEQSSTLEARERYFQTNPRRGWRRWVPISMQVPPEEYDDFAAVILGERFLAKRGQKR